MVMDSWKSGWKSYKEIKSVQAALCKRREKIVVRHKLKIISTPSQLRRVEAACPQATVNIDGNHFCLGNIFCCENFSLAFDDWLNFENTIRYSKRKFALLISKFLLLCSKSFFFNFVAFLMYWKLLKFKNNL